MARMLMIYPDRCTGCRNCTLACSAFHDGEFRPHTSRIQVTTWEMEGFSMPTTCQQCEDAPCVAVCPTGAMHDDALINRVAWDEVKCIGCRMCTLACPVRSGRIRDRETSDYQMRFVRRRSAMRHLLSHGCNRIHRRNRCRPGAQAGHCGRVQEDLRGGEVKCTDGQARYCGSI